MRQQMLCSLDQAEQRDLFLGEVNDMTMAGRETIPDRPLPFMEIAV